MDFRFIFEIRSQRYEENAKCECGKYQIERMLKTSYSELYECHHSLNNYCAYAQN